MFQTLLFMKSFLLTQFFPNIYWWGWVKWVSCFYHHWYLWSICNAMYSWSPLISLLWSFLKTHSLPGPSLQKAEKGLSLSEPLKYYIMNHSEDKANQTKQKTRTLCLKRAFLIIKPCLSLFWKECLEFISWFSSVAGYNINIFKKVA